MNDIKFPVVVVPASALSDMTMTEQDCSNMLLNYTDYKSLSPDEKLEFTVFEHYPQDENFLELADAKVLQYRKDHNYSDVGVTAVPVNDIIALYQKSDDLVLLSYVVELLAKMQNRNRRLCKLIELDAPDIIVKNEVRLLRKLVDELLVGEDECHEGSLQHIGYTLRGDQLIHKVASNGDPAVILSDKYCANCEAYRCGGPFDRDFNIDECKHKDKIIKG